MSSSQNIARELMTTIKGTINNNIINRQTEKNEKQKEMHKGIIMPRFPRINFFILGVFKNNNIPVSINIYIFPADYVMNRV